MDKPEARLKINDIVIMILFIERQKIRSKDLVQGPGVQKTFRLSSHTQEQLNVMPRTMISLIKTYKENETELLKYILYTICSLISIDYSFCFLYFITQSFSKPYEIFLSRDKF